MFKKFLWLIANRNFILLLSIVLGLSIKNSGFAAASALALFGEKAALPAAILSVVLIIFLVLIGLKPKGKSGKQTR